MIFSLGDRRPVFEGSGHFVAGSATLIGDVRLGDGASVWFSAVVRADNDRIAIGAGSNVQDGAVLHTDEGYPLEVGENVTIGHQAMLHGCRIGPDVLIGIGSTILNGAVIGRHSVVGAQALVTENKVFPDGVLILGSPARVVRELKADEIALISQAASSYQQKSRHYREQLEPCEPAGD